MEKTMVTEGFTDSGRILKMEVDYSTTVDEKIPKCQKLCQEGKLTEALDILMSLEKQTRTGADTHSCGRVLVAIVRLCFETKNYAALNEHIVLLTKRRSQIKQAVTKMIQECCTYVDQMPDKKTKLELIDTLRQVTAGKIYVEVERARLTHKLSKMKEDENQIDEACKIMQELQVETFGSMDRREKVELILEQMRLCLAVKDYVRCQIISKKISTKFFEDTSTQDLKLKFYHLMIELDQHEGSYLAVCKHYRAVYDTPQIQEDVEKKHVALKKVVMYLVLSPYDNEQSDLIHRVKEDKNLEEMPKYKELLQLFTTPELINWRLLHEKYESELREAASDATAAEVFGHDDIGKKCWQDLKNRVVEHNIRIMAKYYTRITLKRMAELLDLNEAETEEMLSNLVVNKTVWAKIDRLEGVVSFSQLKDPSEVLNDWSHNLNKLMQLLSKTTHLINKEEMVHKHMLTEA
ncbi:26S proteasome non-ATPase regulatory subunit 12 [Araneus ventricosus]|uniref:26S proteasome non-ATPase regulatory subunit 12 n=1 Tax=Araneus ventricosus TaxID=182803 RepID=A0A4Y2BY17_ARAVE|nr:26S proteasome non-ATPase regulatory subunit 12 [Araneus ventricosus]